MNDILSISKTTLVFEIDRTRSNKAQDRIELTNVDSQKRVGYKIKSTNVARYLVNPSSGILDPLRKLKIDIVLSVNENEDISKMNDKFRLYCIDINDSTVTRQNIDHYIRRNEQNIKKVSINVKISEKYDTTEPVREVRTTDFAEPSQPVNLQAATDNLSQTSMMFDQTFPEYLPGSSNLNNESRLTYLPQATSNMESLLIERENDIMKLMESNSMLQKDISSLKGKIVPNAGEKAPEKKLKMDFWKFLVLFLVGITLGIFLNRSGKNMEIVNVIEA